MPSGFSQILRENMRILKTNPVLTILNSYMVDSPQPSTISYLWNFGSLLGLCLVAQIVTGVLVSMHYQGSASEGFTSVEHVMRDVNDGWLLRICHANMASFFFIAVYLHIARGLYYGSYRTPRVGVWVIGTIIFFLMMATAFLGYVLPFGQMSLWGYLIDSLRCFLEKLRYKYINISIFIVYIVPLFSNINNKYKGWQRIGPHNKDVLSIIFGSLLGDAYAEKRLKGVGTRITFYQESTHVKYAEWLHNILSSRGYCSESVPVIVMRVVKGGKSRKIIRFRTWTYTSFNWIHNLWYIDGKKRIPGCIGEYLTPLALAIWIMDDGSKVSQGLKLCTNSYTYIDCLFLVKVLSEKYSLKASVQLAGTNTKDQFVIYIWKDSMSLLREIVKPYIIPEMIYKVV